MTDIIWRYTGDFMAPDIICRVVRYFQVQKPHALLYAQAFMALHPHSSKPQQKSCGDVFLASEVLNAESVCLKLKHF